MRPVAVPPDRHRLCLLIGAFLLALAATLALAGAAHAAGAQSYPRSSEIALVPDDGDGGDGGTLPTYGAVTGRPGESFNGFDFTNVGIDELDPATLAAYDTVVLNQVFTSDLDAGARRALAGFVTGGGKLIIHDSDATDANDYAWLPVPAKTGRSCQNCGQMGGHATVVENNNMVSAVSTDASYVNVAELPGNTDAVGDANLMVSQADGWFRDIIATNGHGDTGAVHTYATAGGLIIFNGFDTDNIGDAQDSGVDWLSHMWYRELAQGWSPDGLPRSTPLNCSNTVGTLNPAAGTIPESGQPGTTITITGKNLCPGTRVQFGNAKAIVDATVQNTGQMTVVVPRNATSNIKLQNPDGQWGPVAALAIDSFRNLHGFSFINDGGWAAKRDGVTWDDLKVVFGDNLYNKWRPCPTCPLATSSSTSAAQQIFAENQNMGGGLCFGFAVGALRLSQGLDPMNAGDPRRNAGQWAAGQVHDLPAFEQAADPYNQQMRHYLYAWQVSQDSFQYAKAVSDYAGAVKQAADKAGYLLGQLRGALAGGPVLLTIQEHWRDPSKLNNWNKWFGGGGKNAWDGHEIVALDVETHADGSFDIDVYDPNKPFSDAENGEDGQAHGDALSSNQVHVAASGHWVYDGAFGNPDNNESYVPNRWEGEAEHLRPLAFSALKGGALKPWAQGTWNDAVLSGAAVGQVTDSKGRNLYAPDGELLGTDQRADVQVMADAGTAATPGAPVKDPALLLDAHERYTAALAPGAHDLSAQGLDGRVDVAAGGKLAFDAADGRVTLTPAKAGAGTLQLTRQVGDQDLTVGVQGRMTGATTLSVGKAVSVTSAKGGKLTLTVSRAGGNLTPQTFSSVVRVGAGQRLLLGSARRLRPARRVTLTVSGRHGRRHSARLVNRAGRPSVRVLAASVSRKSQTLRVRLALRGARGGSAVLSVRGAGKLRQTISVAVRAGRVTMTVPVGSQRKRARLKLVAVAVSRRGQSSRAVSRTVRVR